jgi:mono/diheme cytochrome c family protein
MYMQSSPVNARPRACRPAGLRGEVLLASIIVIALAALVVSARPAATPVEASAMHGRDAGAVLFHEKGCEHCHGVNGIGTERGPDLSTVGKRLKKPQIEHQIEHGGDAMPAYGTILQPDEVNDLVAYLHSKKKAPKKPAVPLPATPAATHIAGSDPGL